MRWFVLAKTKYRITTYATGIAVGLMIISFLEKSNNSWTDILFANSILIALTIYTGYGIQTYGMQKFIERNIEFFFTGLFAIAIPFRILFRLLKTIFEPILSYTLIKPLNFIFDTFPSKLPGIIQTLYYLILLILISIGIYFFMTWMDLTFFLAKPEEQFRTFVLGGYSLRLNVYGAFSGGLFFGLVMLVVVLTLLGEIYAWMKRVGVKGSIRIRW